ncbi:pyruvate dehydrogenase E1 component beta subunit [Tranquillimonas rosea]|uniref:Pyruvate dehydrogenase E1 component beta subunit n=1 Tax=Tranquillimonas rosea TaxID=641238 RepID=A0A1H9TCT5_9RHOB|nr:transketolase C-terminal domain-containing protein [Tranquillimonas rosea]SER94926.1 pyruvate dehydrogenase E1 component beta subunit [Tranquillimonas rosea]
MTPEALRIPAPEPGVARVTLSRWLVREGDVVRAGDVIAEIVGDTIVREIEALQSGRIGRILVAAGTRDVAVDTAIAIIDPTGAGNDAAPPAAEQRTGETPRGATYRHAIGTALRGAMEADPALLYLARPPEQGGARLAGELRDAFGHARVIDPGSGAEPALGLAVGAALGGQRVVIDIGRFADIYGALEQVLHVAAKTGPLSGDRATCPLVIRGVHGPAGRLGGVHGQDVAALMAAAPGLTVVAPSEPADARALMEAAIASDTPVIFLESETLFARGCDGGTRPDRPRRIGEARIVRTGRDVTLVGFGAAMPTTLSAAERLDAEGFAAEVIDLGTLRPLDLATVTDSVRRTGRCVTVEHGPSQGGIGAYIAARVTQAAFADLAAPVETCAGADTPCPYAEALEAASVPTTADIVAAVRRTRGT